MTGRGVLGRCDWVVGPGRICVRVSFVGVGCVRVMYFGLAGVRLRYVMVGSPAASQRRWAL